MININSRAYANGVALAICIRTYWELVGLVEPMPVVQKVQGASDRTMTISAKN